MGNESIAAAPGRHTRRPVIALLLACGFFARTTDRFFSGQNFSLILQQVMVVGVIAIGQTLIILTARHRPVVRHGHGARRHRDDQVRGRPRPADAAARSSAASRVTTLFGLLNGLLVTRIRLPPFIVTLGTLNIAFAITQLYSSAQTVTDLPDAMTVLGNTFPLGGTAVAYGTVLMLALYLARLVRAARDGRRAATSTRSATTPRRRGCRDPAQRVLLGVYALAGVLYGIASLLSVARTGVGDPNAGQTENLDAITAVVLGGTSLFGGRGVVLGSLIGALIVGVFRNGLTLMGVSSVYQVLITGILVILAVATDQLSREGGAMRLPARRAS